MDKQLLKYRVSDTQLFVRMLETSIDLSDNALALRVLSSAQQELDVIRQALEESVRVDARNLQPSE